MDQSVSASALKIENMAAQGLQGRGVSIALFSHFGEFPRNEVGYHDLMRVLDAGAVEVEPGDILCLWTGRLDRMILRMTRQPYESLHEACAVVDGRDERLLQWTSDSGVAAFASDNHPIEAARKPLTGSDASTNLALHDPCLFRLGVPLGELWALGELADWLRNPGRSRFLLMAPSLRLTAAVGSPLTPVTTA